MIKKQILLTGAGFTYNFGGLLAEGMWSAIYSHKEIKYKRKIRNIMLSDFDYESVYNTIINDYKNKYSDEEKDAITIAVQSAYEMLDNIIRKHTYTGKSYFPNIYGIQKLINLFSGENENGYFFTLNQDMFVERHYYNGKKPLLPGIPGAGDWFNPNFGKEELKTTDFRPLPSLNKLDKYLSPGNNYYYIKLHGSFNWKSSDTNKKQTMVIGHGKMEQIDKEPLLSWYFDIFKDVLSQQGRKLLVIGYGFKDRHINEIISKGIKKHGLELYIISPVSPNVFKEELYANNKEIYKSSPTYDKNIGTNIWSGLSGYFHWDLVQMYPWGESGKTEMVHHLEKSIFTD